MPDSVIKTYIKDTRLVQYTDLTITAPEQLLDEIEKIRSRGYALEIGEINEGIGSISFPIFDKREECIGTISLSGANEQIYEEEETAAETLSNYINSLQPLG